MLPPQNVEWGDRILDHSSGGNARCPEARIQYSESRAFPQAFSRESGRTGFVSDPEKVLEQALFGVKRVFSYQIFQNNYEYIKIILYYLIKCIYNN